MQNGEKVYKLIILNYKTPVIKGNEASIMIRNLLKEEAFDQPRPYIVCLTNFYENLENKIQRAKYGIDEVVQKPIFKVGMYNLL